MPSVPKIQQKRSSLNNQLHCLMNNIMDKPPQSYDDSITQLQRFVALAKLATKSEVDGLLLSAKAYEWLHYFIKGDLFKFRSHNEKAQWLIMTLHSALLTLQMVKLLLAQPEKFNSPLLPKFSDELNISTETIVNEATNKYLNFFNEYTALTLNQNPTQKMACFSSINTSACDELGQLFPKPSR